MQHSFLLSVTLLIILYGHIGWCWQWCYVCSEEGKAGSCQRSPVEASSDAKAINCTSKYCTTVMVTYKDGEGRSFARLCENIDRGNWCLHDSFITTCYLTCQSHFCNNRVPDSRYLPSGGHFGPLKLPRSPGPHQSKTALTFSRHKESSRGKGNEWTQRETVEDEEPANSVFRQRQFPPFPDHMPSIRIQPKEKKSLKETTVATPTIPYRGPSYRYLGNSIKRRKPEIASTTQVVSKPTSETSTVSVRSDKQKATTKPSTGSAPILKFSFLTNCIFMFYSIASLLM